jgi:hypothetical protein
MRGQHSQWWEGVAALAFFALLSACDNNEQAKKPNPASETINRETALMSDPEQAGPELEKRLAQRVRVDGGLILVEPALSLFVLPISTPWTLQCSSGMTIVFGNSVNNSVSQGETSEDFEVETGNDVAITLTVGNIDQKNCEILAPRIGKRLLAILRQDQPARVGEKK